LETPGTKKIRRVREARGTQPARSGLGTQPEMGMKIDVGQAEVVTLRAGSLDVVLDKAKGVVRVVLPDGGVMLTEPQARLLGRWLVELTQEEEGEVAAPPESPRWRTWSGGRCPVEPDVKVRPQFRCGQTGSIKQASHCYWEHTDSDYDIVEYVVMP
jgi:hypothetical protein